MSKAPLTARPFQLAIISTCPEPWGGSEELWWGAATVLAKQEHRVYVFKTNIDIAHPRIQHLKQLNCPTWDLDKLRLVPNCVNRVLPGRYQFTAHRKKMLFLKMHLQKMCPDLVVISQGENYDGLAFARLCERLKQPYVLISQKATERHWPSDKARIGMRASYEKALQCFFVSQHNQHLTEDQIGVSLSNALVVRNPFLVSRQSTLPWPDEKDGLRLACVGRLYLIDKGQDILLRVLAKEKWRHRKLYVSFFGKGINREGLIELATRLDLKNVSFVGYVEDVESIWREHHALVLPSRAEGLPLVLVEAMMCGRTAIVTNVGGSAEVLTDEVTGFVAAGALESAVDEALEKAWARRGEWQKIGELAASQIRKTTPQDPAEEFANHLLRIIDEKSSKCSNNKGLSKPQPKII